MIHANSRSLLLLSLALLPAVLDACGGSSGNLPVATPDAGDCVANPASCICTSDAQCPFATPRCDKNSGKCVRCLPLNDNCARGTKCVATNGSYSCQSGCQVSADCPKTDGGSSAECCTNACIDTSADTQSCGACGKSCAAVPNASASCKAGVCGLNACNTGFANCDNQDANGCEVDTTADGKNCGGCGKVCPPVPNGSGSCQKSVCTIMCSAGFVHCSKNPADGCEVNQNIDVNNCGGCGTICGTVANAVSGCTAGMCAVQSCNANFGDCDASYKNGCEAMLLADIANCGACGKSCGVIQNGEATCKKGVCGIGSCTPGWADCDGLLANGCEVHIDADAMNCGACSRLCKGQNSVQGCMGGACIITMCSQGWADCNMSPADGCEGNVAMDVANCGGCGKVCPAVQNAVVGCANATCAIASCNFGWADCNKNAGDGCEVDLLTIANCGSCGVACPAPAHATAGCNGGMCGIGMCDALYGNCDMSAANGCERSLSVDVTNCGACNKACSYANAAPLCLNGVCGMGACNAGYADCNKNAADGCEANLNTDAANCGKCGTVCPMATPTCQAGACISAGVTYMSTFAGGVAPTAQQCTDWNTFRTNLTGNYTTITFKGSNDMVGRTCAGASANQICQGLHNGTAVNLVCNGNTWRTGTCGGGIELSVDGALCTCGNYEILPCLASNFWGGINGMGCQGTTQSITVTCQ